MVEKNNRQLAWTTQRALTKFQLFDGIYDHNISTYASRLKDVVLDSK